MILKGLDSWLESPYVNAAREQDDFERWCELNDRDPEDDSAWEAFEEFLFDGPEPPEPERDDWDLPDYWDGE